MRIKPIILDEICTKHTNYVIDFKLDYNITFITGDSGVGKSAVYSFLEEYSSEDKRVRCFNYIDHNKGYNSSIRNSKGKLFVIDNADILLSDNLKRHIVFDDQNQYIIIGRNPSSLLLTREEIYELASEKNDGVTYFRLEKAF